MTLVQVKRGHELVSFFRHLRCSPGFSFAVVLTLALGIGANTAIFSVVRAVLLKPLPYPGSERLVWLGESSAKATGISVTWINYQHWRDENHSFEGMAPFEQVHLTLTGRGEPRFTHAALVGGGFFRLLGMHPLLGSFFTSDAGPPGAANVVVLSHQFWMDKLGGNPSILGATLAFDDKPYQVIGVASPTWEFFAGDYYLPIAPFRGNAPKRSQHGSMRVLARLKPDITLAAARADLDSILSHLADADPGPENDHHSYGVFLADRLTRPIRSTLFILMGAVGLVLLIACANVASLVMTRSTRRVTETAIRAVIGAGPLRLIREGLTENLALAVSGGLTGLILAQGCLRAIVNFGPKDIPRLAETKLDIPVFLFATAISIATGLLVGAVPILTSEKLDLASALKDSPRGSTGAKKGQSLRSTLVVAEIAITLVLAFASGLLLRSLIVAETSYPGFRSDHLVELELVLPSSAYRTREAQHDFYDRLIADLRTVPGATDVGAVLCPPSAGDCGDGFYSVLDRPAPPRSDVPLALFNIADPAYFHCMGIPLREGRAFTPADRTGSERAAIINETLARHWWPNQSAIGKHIKSGGPYIDGPIYEIVGVAGNVSQMGLDSEPLPEIYLPFAQSPSGAQVVMIRTSGDPESLLPAIRRRVAAIDRNLPIQNLRVFEKTLAATLERRRFSTLLLTGFAVLALILAGVGVFGLLNYWVSIREEEIAVRMALGAQPATIMRWAGSQALKLALLGIAMGAAAALFVSRWMKSLVFGVSAANPLLIGIAAIVLFTLSMLGAALPIWRAIRVDAVEKLHHG